MSTVQFNLLPDVKLRYIQSQKTRNVVTTTAVLVSVLSLVIFLILLLSAGVLQKKQLSDADKQIATSTKQLQNTAGFSKVLTIHNQLSTLSSLHKNKHITSRVFGYLPQVTPINVRVASLSMDLTSSSLIISGTADSHRTVNAFIDTLKFTTYKISDQAAARAAFPSVVESGFSVTPNNVTYSLAVHFDPQLFSNDLSQAPKLTVPKLVSTRSVVGDPANVLFNGEGR